jgi:hypothetical protein
MVYTISLAECSAQITGFEVQGTTCDVKDNDPAEVAGPFF